MPYAKAVAAALAAVLAAVVPALYSAGPLGFSEWVNIVILAAGAMQVFNAANVPGWGYAKLAAAVASAGAVALSSALSDHDVTRAEWIQVVVAVLGAFAVYRVSNVSRVGRHAKPDA